MVRTAGMSSRDLVRSMIRSGSLIVAGGEAVGQFDEDGLAGEAVFPMLCNCPSHGEVQNRFGGGWKRSDLTMVTAVRPPARESQ